DQRRELAGLGDLLVDLAKPALRRGDLAHAVTVVVPVIVGNRRQSSVQILTLSKRLERLSSGHLGLVVVVLVVLEEVTERSGQVNLRVVGGLVNLVLRHVCPFLNLYGRLVAAGRLTDVGNAVDDDFL